MSKENNGYNFEEGEVLLVDKPLHWTSFDLVKRIRSRVTRYLGVKKIKVGHAGTLDPLATGLMIICTGKATKRIDSYLTDTKEYVAKIFLGATTPSFDLESQIDATYPTSHITKDLVQKVLESFTGEIDQVPPTFSAIKIDGKRAYDLARSGQEVAMVSRKVTLIELELLSFELPYIEVRILCSKGTYIRSFARDIGEALESGGYLAGLQRTKIGSFSLVDAFNAEELLNLLEKMKQKPELGV